VQGLDGTTKAKKALANGLLNFFLDNYLASLQNFRLTPIYEADWIVLSPMAGRRRLSCHHTYYRQ
jgi:hypothetical protein